MFIRSSQGQCIGLPHNHNLHTNVANYNKFCLKFIEVDFFSILENNNDVVLIKIISALKMIYFNDNGCLT